MINAFKDSRRIAWIGGIILGLAAGAGGWFLLQGSDQPLLHRGILAALATFVGANIAVYFARVIATRNYQSRLLLLYENLDPSAFLAAVEPLAKAPMGSSARCTLLVHLANGWLYAGEPDQAMKILDNIQLPEKAVASRGLVLSNQATCWLAKGNLDKAQKCMDDLKKLLHNKACNKEFAAKARHALSYLQMCVDIGRKKKVDLSILEQDFEKNPSPFHRLDVQYRIALAARRAGDTARLEKAQAYIREHGGKTVFVQLLPQ